MFKNLHLFLTVNIIFLSGTLLAAAQESNLVTINFLKFSTKVPFTPTTTIAELKQYVQDNEGPFPVDHLELRKTETVRPGWLLPKKIGLILEDEKTCQHYDITAASILHGYLRLTSFQRRHSS